MTAKRLNIDLIEDLFVREELIRLYDENEQLKKSLSQFAKVNREGVKKVQSLAKENEQLKQENKKLKQSFGIIRNSISRLYRNGKITFDERAFYLRKLSEIEDGDDVE